MRYQVGAHRCARHIAAGCAVVCGTSGGPVQGKWSFRKKVMRKKRLTAPDSGRATVSSPTVMKRRVPERLGDGAPGPKAVESPGPHRGDAESWALRNLAKSGLLW